MADRIIVSRHPAAIEFIARESGDEYARESGDEYARESGEPVTGRIVGGSVRLTTEDNTCFRPVVMPIIASATADDVRGKVVYGNLPLHLAALAAEVVAIEFSGIPPRGAEYTLADMDAAGARLAAYTVTAK